MCDTGSIMANQMDDLIEGGIRERDAMSDEIELLRKKVGVMQHFLTPWELKYIDHILSKKK